MRLTGEIRKDLMMWKTFLQHPTVYCHLFRDFTRAVTAYQVNFFTDASMIGFGGLCYNSWMTQNWDTSYIRKKNLDTECLELYTVLVASLAWLHKFRNCKIIIFCDNQNICWAVNKTTSSCQKCMVLVCLLIFKCMTENVKLFLQYIKSKDNKFSDLLSRDRIDSFKQ